MTSTQRKVVIRIASWLVILFGASAVSTVVYAVSRAFVTVILMGD